MNKFAAFAVLALAALAVSVSTAPTTQEEEEMTQVALKTTNEDETAELRPKNLEQFDDFCINSRDYVLADIKNQANQVSSNVFSMLFNMGTEIAREGIDVQQQATNRLAAQLANPEAAIEGGDSEIDQIIANGQAQIQGESQPKSLLTAFQSAVTAVSKRVGGLVSERINYLIGRANPTEVFKVLSKGCDQIAFYEKELRVKLEEYKQQLPEQYKSYDLDAIPCATTMRVIRGEGMCALFRVAAAPVKKIIGAK